MRLTTRAISLRFVAIGGLLLAAVIPVKAGIFGSIGSAVGIGGDVGKGLGFIDSVLPGGSTFTDVVGAPGGAAFGKAIKDWKEANNESIQKLGATNDETVKKLVAGLGTVQADLNKGLEQNVLLLSEGLSKSIADLDDALRNNVERLDASLNSQTARLDTVFQKQTSSLFQLGQILITVLVVAGAFHFLSKIIAASGEKQGWREILRRTKYRVAIVCALAVVFIAGTWLWPDPSGVKTLRSKFVDSYAKSMQYEDYLGASVVASQLAILSPDDSIIRSYELKSRAFRDLFFRPTVMLQRDELLEVLRLLAKADQWRVDATDRNDPEIAAALALVAFQSFESNIDLMRASTLARNTGNAFGGVGENADIERPLETGESTSSTKSRWRIVHDRLIAAARGLTVEPEMIQLALPDLASDSRSLLQTQHVPQALSVADAAPSNEEITAFSPVADLTTATVNRIEVAKFYRVLLSFYFEQQVARLRNASAPNVNEPACEALRYAAEWHNAVFSRRAQSQALVAALLAGPSAVLVRLRTSLGDSNPCPRLDNADFSRFTDVVSLWFSSFTSGVSGPSEKAGAANLRQIADGVAARQKTAFDAFETLTNELRASLAIANPDPGQLATRRALTGQWLEACTSLGLHAGASSNRSQLKPSLLWAREGGLQEIEESTAQKIAFLYLYAPIF